ncbi:putative inactive group IIC secretory phospholipase A2 isoform X3 [Cavia porcellus]|uniref:putative inactive group IIC secretory phospholipase A2 isoform X3 n=1 Tax=Cavia porcellus TaxID=10141 RepID=UPI000661A8F2
MCLGVITLLTFSCRQRQNPGAQDPPVSSEMKVIAILIVFVSCYPRNFSEIEGCQPRTKKRTLVMAPTLGSFWQFQRMVKHVTGRSAFFSYYGYGCYCGLGGKGVPVDDTDRCCRAHDCCYKKLKELGCQPLLSSYQFHIINGTVVCGCTLGPSSSCLCGLKACECDKRSVYCFKDSLPTYEKNFKQFFFSRPQCSGHKHQC